MFDPFVILRKRCIPAFAGMALLAASSAHADLGTNDNLIVPGTRVGLVTANTTESELKVALKPGEYKRALIDVGEGYCRHGSVLYPGTEKEISIVWKSEGQDVDCMPESASLQTLEDEDSYANPAYAKIDNKGLAWHTQEGIKTGLTVAELQKINGRFFTFSGFGWDYGGRVLSWEKGTVPGSLAVALNYGELPLAMQKRIPMGEGKVQSDDPKLPPGVIKIDTLLVEFP
jgi:hypothetical protein